MEKLNNLLSLNNEVEEIYSEVEEKVSDVSLKNFFKERALERHEFSELIKLEIENLGETPEPKSIQSKRFYKTKMKVRNLVFSDNELDLLDEVFNLKQETIDNYNDVLMQPHLPLKLCKLLVKQRDNVQSTMRVLKREAAFVA
ncbi:PA2169 family four-helix-bundle protein [Tamlana sp. PT2-4]|uniref:PA2169 family four-helix-bundle protein n=2 Tax=Neotamlana laminarinivorans TaxID=2883124 RepID=A0A9X1HZN7_9FLAO|nr:PA2169 family four-helix-bundle protein [Tamlana laminarinivorans]